MSTYDIHICMSDKYPQKAPKKTEYKTVRWNPAFARCFRCQYEWIPRTENIKTCAGCRSPYWDTARDEVNYLQMRDKAHKILQEQKYRGYKDSPEGEKCVDCGEPAKHWEHRNYARPLIVEPVCHSCNLKRGSTHNRSKNYLKPLEEKKLKGV